MTLVRIRARPIGTAALLLGSALAAWIVTVQRMRGMDAGPGPSSAGSVTLGIWVTMTAAMMLPSAAPMVLVYAHFSAAAASGCSSPATWSRGALPPPAYGTYRLVAGWASAGWAGSARAHTSRAPDLGCGALPADAAEGGLSPPLPWAAGLPRARLAGGEEGALRMGDEHGLVCVGCCRGLMLVLFALGVMSLFWTAPSRRRSSPRRCFRTGGALRMSRGGLVLLGRWLRSRLATCRS